MSDPKLGRGKRDRLPSGHHDYKCWGGTMETQMWTVAEAKAKFSEVIDRALREGPQTITRNRRTAAVIVGADEWQRKSTRVGNLAEFFAAAPLRGIRTEVAAASSASTRDQTLNFLLDTNAVSEWVKPRPNPGLIRWMESADS